MTYSNKLRRPWTPEEDEALMFLKDELKVAKWPQISRQMVENFKLGERTEKQCRDRYVNFLRDADNSYIWRAEDQNKLMDLYYELGNKWSEISTHFPNTYFFSITASNGIYIKNKFYSRLRKAIRHLNIIIETYLSSTQTKFSFDIIFMLVNISNKKQKFIENHQIKELLQANPKVFEDIIIKLIEMTSVSTKNHLKKKKIQRISPKEEFMWRKLIEILKYLQKQITQVHTNDLLDKDLHLQTNHYEGFRYLGTLGIKKLFEFSEITAFDPYQQKLVSNQHSIEAGYIEISEFQESMLRRKTQLIIISDQKRFCDKQRKDVNHNSLLLSEKEETLPINEAWSPFKKMVIQNDKSLAALSKDYIMELPQQNNAIAQP